MSLPSIYDYLPEVMDKIAGERPVAVSRPVLREAVKGVAVSAAGGAVGYAVGKLLAQQYGPRIPPAALGATGVFVGAALMAAKAHQKGKFQEVLRRVDEGRKD